MGRWDMAAFLIQLKILKRPTALREAWASNQWWEQWRKITLEMDVQTKFKTLMLTWVQTHQDTWSKTSPSLSKPPLKNAPLRTWTSKTPTMDHQQLKCSKPPRTVVPSQPLRRSTRSSKLPEGTTLCRWPMAVTEIIRSITISIAMEELWWLLEKTSTLRTSTAKWYLKFSESSSCFGILKEMIRIKSSPRTLAKSLTRTASHPCWSSFMKTEVR